MIILALVAMMITTIRAINILSSTLHSKDLFADLIRCEENGEGDDVVKAVKIEYYI